VSYNIIRGSIILKLFNYETWHLIYVSTRDSLSYNMYVWLAHMKRIPAHPYVTISLRVLLTQFCSCAWATHTYYKKVNLVLTREIGHLIIYYKSSNNLKFCNQKPTILSVCQHEIDPLIICMYDSYIWTESPLTHMSPFR